MTLLHPSSQQLWDMQVRVNSATSSEEVGDLLGRRHSSGAMPSPLPSSLLKGLEPSGSPSPEQSHEEALSRPRGFHTSLSGASVMLAPCSESNEALLGEVIAMDAPRTEAIILVLGAQSPHSCCSATHKA